MIRGSTARGIPVGVTMILFIPAGIPGMATDITHRLIIIIPMVTDMVATDMVATDMGIQGMDITVVIMVDMPA